MPDDEMTNPATNFLCYCSDNLNFVRRYLSCVAIDLTCLQRAAGARQ
jgi:hypothetical protein